MFLKKCLSVFILLEGKICIEIEFKYIFDIQMNKHDRFIDQYMKLDSISKIVLINNCTF